MRHRERMLVVALAALVIGGGLPLAAAQTFNSGSTRADGAFNPPSSVPPGTTVNGSTYTVPLSQTATFAVLRLYIDNWRWQGVPFYLRSGKKLEEKCSEIIIQFKCPPHGMFQLPADYVMTANILGLNIQPDEGIHLVFEAKVPDSDQEMRSVDMDFHYRDSFTEVIPDAYERLILEALRGDASLFTRSDGIEAAWKLFDSIANGWEANNLPVLSLYRRGSWGPAEATALLGRDGRLWRLGCLGG